MFMVHPHFVVWFLFVCFLHVYLCITCLQCQLRPERALVALTNRNDSVETESILGPVAKETSALNHLSNPEARFFDLP